MASTEVSGEPVQVVEVGTQKTEGNTQTALQEQTDGLPSSTPVEMSQISQAQATTSESSPGLADPQSVAGVSEPPVLPGPYTAGEATTQANSKSVQASDSEHHTSTEATTTTIPAATTQAIGPSFDRNPSTNAILQTSNASNPPTSPTDNGPSVLITLILLTGKRHPFKIDTKYLRKRNIFKEDTDETDPFKISIYTLKELIWRDWRDDWDPRPTIPGSIRLIHFGKLLEDKLMLKDMKLNPTEPNIFHMSVKPQDMIDDEENAKLKGGRAGSSRSRRAHAEDGETSAGCCRCCVM